MRRTIALGTTVILLGGCALPLPFQVASWALDGISMLTTQKSVTDHGLSLVAQKDCAIWRGVVEGELCRDEAETDVMIAKDAPKTTNTQVGFAPLPASEVTKTVEKMPVSMPEPHLVVARNDLIVRNVYARLVAQQSVSPVTVPNMTPPNMTPGPLEMAKWNPPLKAQPVSLEPEAGVYFVIGSFRTRESADWMTGRYDQLGPAIISAKLDGKNIYRVVVGPVAGGQEKATHNSLRRAGISDTWGIRVNPADWLLAKRGTGIRQNPAEIAKLPK